MYWTVTLYYNGPILTSYRITQSHRCNQPCNGPTSPLALCYERTASEKAKGVAYFIYSCILLDKANLRNDQNVSILT